MPHIKVVENYVSYNISKFRPITLRFEISYFSSKLEVMSGSDNREGGFSSETCDKHVISRLYWPIRAIWLTESHLVGYPRSREGRGDFSRVEEERRP